MPRTIVALWGMLTIILLAYVLVIGWGPALGTVAGLRAQVIAQKVIAIAVVAALTYLSVETDRIVAGSAPMLDTRVGGS